MQKSNLYLLIGAALGLSPFFTYAEESVEAIHGPVVSGPKVESLTTPEKNPATQASPAPSPATEALRKWKEQERDMEKDAFDEDGERSPSSHSAGKKDEDIGHTDFEDWD